MGHAVASQLAGLGAEQRRCLLFVLAERLSAGGAVFEPARWLAG